MLDPDGLNVWSDDQLVGYVWRNFQGQMGFRYDDEWLASRQSYAISVSLPLQRGDFSPELGIAHRFFANLLSEARARD
jgi:serine/threonine-protein kinase HipA